MSAFGIAIVGTGGIADVYARDIARLNGRAQLVAAVDTDDERLTAYIDRWNVPIGYSDLSVLLDTVHPDLVVLATPPAFHAEQAKTCLARGCTVLCEKPPTLSLAELDDVAAAEIAGRGRFAAVVQHRFGSGAQTLRLLMGDPRMGMPTVAVCNTLWFRPDEYFNAPWRGRWDVEGGGPTLGHGIHQIDLLVSVLGPWQQVTASAARQARPTETEDVSAAVVTFENGVVATVLNSLISPRETSYLRFDFTHATVELEHLYGHSDVNWRVTAAPGHERAVTKAWNAGPKGRPSGHAAQLTAVFDALERGDDPPVTSTGIRATMELISAIYASAFTGRPVNAGDIGPDSPFYHRMDGHGAPWASARQTATREAHR